MSVIKWKSCYETQIVSLDKEHQVLVELINQLYRAIREQRPEEVMLSIFDELLAYTEKHFVHEERLLEEYKYPELEQHRLQHQQLTEDVLSYRKQLEAAETPSAMDVMGFLRRWLLDHIADNDMRYGPYLESRGGRFLD